MVTRINSSKNMHRVLNYNEQKLKEGRAEILHAQNFLKEAATLSFYEKERTFKLYTALNERTTTNAVHISLNFDPSENLSNDSMIAIAVAYMDRLGFGDQPYLVYRHYDAAHPHLHLVSTNIKRDGTRISLHNLGRRLSEKARKEIEQEFNLVKAEGRGTADGSTLTPINAQRVQAGKQTVKRAISNVLAVVLGGYKFCSLPELNAVLKLYNVRAERCGEASDTYRHGGLYYRVLDQLGNSTGTPIKASLFYMKPTLKNLEPVFEQNKASGQPFGTRLKTVIDLYFLRAKNKSLEGFISALDREGVSTVLRQNEEGFVYGITYVDHKTKCVFNGSDLGKGYSAKAVQERCGMNETILLSPSQNEGQVLAGEKKEIVTFKRQATAHQGLSEPFTDGDVIDNLLRSESEEAYLPQVFKKGKKSKKRQRPR